MDLLVKRVFDIFAALTSMAITIPIFLFASVFIYCKIGAPILFAQVRPGLNGKPFRLVKFRTMTDARDADGNLLPDADRLPPLGRWLRATSIDELPGLWNVLKGDMSLVGPRPLLMQYLPLYSSVQTRRHEVKPGVTGWAQVNGRNALSWEEKFALDVWYVENRSLLLDMKILALTVQKVFQAQGIAAEGEATMSEFRGSLLGECRDE